MVGLFFFFLFTGEPVTYRIRYRPFNKQTYRYEDIGNETQYTLVGLDPSTHYLFSIMACNMYGDSSYLSESLKVTTLSKLYDHNELTRRIQIGLFNCVYLLHLKRYSDCMIIQQKRVH